MTIAGLEIVPAVLVLGLIVGMTYGLLAIGLTLIYRSNRIINFAHGEIGTLGAAFLGLAVNNWSSPYWIAFPFALAISAAAGALCDVAVVRRLRRAPRLMSIVGTLGFAQFVLLFSLTFNSRLRAGALYPQPAGFPRFNVGPLIFTQAHFGMVFLAPLAGIALVLFLRYSRFGLAIRGSASNPEAARMVGVPAGRMSTLSWAIAGALSAVTAILVFPSIGFIAGGALGPGLLLRALAAAVIARMTSLPIALGAGVGIGMVEQLLFWNYPRAGLVELVLFVAILGALLRQSRRGVREEERGSWTAVVPWSPLPERFLKVWTIRNLGKIIAGIALAGLLLVAWLSTNSTAIVFVIIIAISLVGLSLAVITGLAGQLSLGQFAIAGVGATASVLISTSTGNFLLGFAVAGAAATAASVAIGIPALRIRGLMLAVTTLSFALVAQGWLFQQPWMLGEALDPGRPIIGPFAMNTGKSYYLFSLVFLIFGVWLARNVRRGGLGRIFVALRDNEDAARAFSIAAVARKLQAFAIAGFIAGVGGAVFGHAIARLSFESFPPTQSINVVAMTVIGGIGILAGPILGAFYVIGLPAFVELGTAGLAASSLGWLILILYFPGGLAQLFQPVRDRMVDFLAARAGFDPAAERLSEEQEFITDRSLASSTAAEAAPVEAGTIVLQARGLAKSYGGVAAVDGVDLDLIGGETLGIIGPNGAGKTTLFELLSGFVPPDRGGIHLLGRDVSRLTPEKRAHIGLVRSFQDAGLFETMTVLDTVRLALERHAPTRLVASVLGLRGAERRKDERARELVHVMGLDRYRHKQINELSTGTRRIVELACVVALEPKVLLLDEPSSGIAQRETEKLGEMLVDIKNRLNATLVVIEHDMPLITSLSDRIIAMESGRVIASGSPSEVQADPRVVESYLGGDIRTIQRSGKLADRLAAPAPSEELDWAQGRCSQITSRGTQCSRNAIIDGLCRQHAQMAGAIR